MGSATAVDRNSSTPTYDSPFDLFLTPTAAVPVGDRVSADQQFAKSWEVRQNVPTALSAFRIILPARVFFSRAPGGKLTGDVLTHIRVSGKTSAVVDDVRVTFQDGKPLTSDEIATLRRDLFRPQRGPLLIGVELARRNSLRTLLGRGADGVVLENVLYSSEYDAAFQVGSILAMDTTTTLAWDDGRLFVSDQAGSVAVGTLSLQGSVQVELAAVNTTNMVSVNPSSDGNLTLFIGDLGPTVTVHGAGVRMTGVVCIADGNDVGSNTTYDVYGSKDRVSYPNEQPRAFNCTKQPLPERVPASTETTSTSSAASAGRADCRIPMYAMSGVMSLYWRRYQRSRRLLCAWSSSWYQVAPMVSEQ